MSRYYVIIDRSDRTRTYKGPLSLTQSVKEVQAWRHAFPDYESSAQLVDKNTKADCRKWRKATKDGGYYTPSETITEMVERDA